MAFQVSPGVNVSEIDLSTVVPATSTTEGAIAGVFRWGPVNERVLVSSEVDLVRRFGRPLNSNTTTLANPTTVQKETVTFSDLVLPTAGTTGTDTYTLTVSSETFTTAAADYATKAEIATALQASVVDAGITSFTVGVNGDGHIVLVYAVEVNQIDTTYSIVYNGSGTGETDSTNPVITQGEAPVYTQQSWSNIETFFSAADFLAYSDALYVVRVSDGATAAGAQSTALEDIEARYPGALGNSINVQIIDGTQYGSTDLGFDYEPDAGNFHIVVADDADGTISGTANAVLESFENVSKTPGSKRADGSNNYIVDVLENSSSWIRATGVTSIASMTAAAALSGGTDGSDESSIALGTVQLGYELFRNGEEVDVSFLIQGKARGDSASSYAGLGNYLTDLAEDRKDCIALISPARELVVGITDTDTILDNIVDDLGADGRRSTYAVYDTGYKYRYDKYNDQYIYTPLNGDIAGLCVRTDDQRDPWFSPAGLSRGIVKNIVKLAWNPSKTQRDQLYKRNFNPVITQVGQGTLLFGDKTFANKASAFDRINVRRLFIVLEKAIARASRAMLFEFNDEFTRAQFRNMVEPFLRDVQGRRGIYDFKVVADESNNTPEVIDQNRFVGDIYIKPARSINFIQLNFVAVRTGVEFSEIVGSV
jgi:hypothetical protein